MTATDDLAGLRVLVTGAGHGIGRATAEAFVAAGATVICADQNAPALASLAARGLRTVAVDVAAGNAPELLLREAEAAGGLDVLVNNAGICPVARLEDTGDDTWDRVHAVNLRAVFRLSRAALPLLRASGRGRIVNIASISALLANEGMGAYTSSKHAVAGFSKSLAVEVGRDGITVNYIVPGAIVTGITRAAVEADAAFRDFWIGKSAVGRWGQPEDIANAVLFLCSRAADFITGHGLVVDGGASVRA